jgi:hypothetical protein
VLRAGFRRIFVLLVVVLGGTAAASAVLGALAGADIARAIATGFYLIGSAVLVGCFVVGVRGPLRSEPTEEQDDATLPASPGMLRFRGRRRLRKATAEERHEGRRIALGLFGLGIAVLLLAAAIDPSRSAF